MERLYKTLITLYRINYKIFNSRDDAILYCKINPTANLKDLETITLYRVSHEFWIWATANTRTIMTIENSKEKNTYYLSYSIDRPPYALDLTLGILEGTYSKEKVYKESINEIHPYGDFTLWQALIDTLLNKGYHVRDGISPFQLYEHKSKFFSTKKELVEYFSKNPSDFTDYRTINLYPSATNDGRNIVVVEDTYSKDISRMIHFIREGENASQYQSFRYSYPILGLHDSYNEKMLETDLIWEDCIELPKKYLSEKAIGGYCMSYSRVVADSIFKASKNHHALITVTPISVGSNHLFLYDGKFYTNFNDVFNRCKKDNRFLNDSVRVYEYSNEVSKTGAIKTYMYGDNVAECFAYCDENSYSRLGINEEGEISSIEILDTSLEQIQQVFYYFMTKGLTPNHTTNSINKYFDNKQKLSSLEKVLKP